MLPDWLISAAKLTGFLVVLLGPLAILLMPNLGQYRTLEEFFRRVARDGKGKVDLLADGPIPYPQLSVPIAGHTMRILPDLAQEDDWPGSLLVEVAGPFSLPRIDIRPLAPITGLPAGVTPVAFPDPYLTARFSATTDEPALWEHISARLSEKLFAMARLTARPEALPVDHPDRAKVASIAGAIAVSVSPERIQLRRLDPIKDAIELLELVESARGLITELFAACPDAPPPQLKGPLCQNCGSGVVVPELRCRRCQTVYHRDCWATSSCCTLYPCRCQIAVPGTLAAVA